MLFTFRRALHSPGSFTQTSPPLPLGACGGCTSPTGTSTRVSATLAQEELWLPSKSAPRSRTMYCWNSGRVYQQQGPPPTPSAVVVVDAVAAALSISWSVSMPLLPLTSCWHCARRYPV